MPTTEHHHLIPSLERMLAHRAAEVEPIDRSDEIAGSALMMLLTAPPRESRRSAIWLAAAAIAATGFVATVAVTALRGGGPAPTDQPTAPTASPVSAGPPTTYLSSTAPESSADYTILAPRPDGAWVIDSLRPSDLSGQAYGAVVALDGTVFSLSVMTGPSWPPDYETWNEVTTAKEARTVGGFDVAAQGSEISESVVSRTVRDDCWTIGVTTAGEEMWSADFETLIGGLSVSGGGGLDGAPVEFTLPDGWRSLGGGRMLTGWSMNLRPAGETDSKVVSITQVPNAPIGYLVGGLEDVHSVEWEGRERWETSNTLTGDNAVVGYSAIGPFRIESSELTLGELHQLAEDLVLTPTDGLPVTDSPDSEDVPRATVAPSPAGCRDIGTGLAIVEP